jgi:CubicO group peptidase (beta-lactamase class C family)
MKFIEALRKGELLKPETLKLMSTDRIEDRRGDNWIPDYGYGLGVKCARPGKSTGIYGWGGAAGADMIVDAKNGITLYYAQHVLRSPVAAMKTRIIYLVQKLLGYEPDGVICHVASKKGEENAKKFGQ